MTGPADAIAAVRLDKWLWAARFYKTRSLASAAIAAGQVRVDGDRVKPARNLRVADRVSVRKDGLVWDVEVVELGERRGSAADAALLYRETGASVQTRADAITQRRAARANAPQYDGRPSKRERRKLQDFLDEP